MQASVLIPRQLEFITGCKSVGTRTQTRTHPHSGARILRRKLGAPSSARRPRPRRAAPLELWSATQTLGRADPLPSPASRSLAPGAAGALVVQRAAHSPLAAAAPRKGGLDLPMESGRDMSLDRC